ncbi:MAG: hypothetical protein WCJ09_12950 [Planctomycetota bacterium]
MYLHSLSEIMAERNRIDLEMLAGGATQDLLTQYGMSFPKVQFTNSDITLMQREGTGDRFIAAKCFPPAKDGRIAPWLEYEFDRYILGWQLERFVESHAKELWAMDQAADSQRIGLVFRGSFNEESAAISALASDLLGTDGSIAKAGVARAGRVLRNLGSRVQISEISGHPEILKKQWNSLPNVLIDRTPYAIFIEGLRTDWLITQALFDHRESIPTKQGSAVMEIGKRVFLKGAIDRTLKRFEFGAEFKIDGKRLMTTGPITGGLPVEEMGVDLPDGFADLRKLLPKTKE